MNMCVDAAVRDWSAATMRLVYFRAILRVCEWEQRERSEVGAARRTSGACAERSVCGAERSKEIEMISKWTPLPAGVWV